MSKMGPRPRPRQQSRSRQQQARRSSASSSQSQSDMSESTQLGTTTNSSAGGFPVPTGHPPGASPYPTQYGPSPYPTQYGLPASNQGAAENPYAPKSLPTPYGGGLPPLHGPGPHGPPISTPRTPMNTGAAISTGERGGAMCGMFCPQETGANYPSFPQQRQENNTFPGNGIVGAFPPNYNSPPQQQYGYGYNLGPYPPGVFPLNPPIVLPRLPGTLACISCLPCLIPLFTVIGILIYVLTFGLKGEQALTVFLLWAGSMIIGFFGLGILNRFLSVRYWNNVMQRQEQQQQRPWMMGQQERVENVT
ncbi:unnamed protein product [Orchesella dallaii]|uniref:Uncharacterized protein n=1 Tax=Orchesella dallaii TaxID=48710 RepID=A0ABP1RYX5_9HEXA